MKDEVINKFTILERDYISREKQTNLKFFVNLFGIKKKIIEYCKLNTRRRGNEE